MGNSAFWVTGQPRHNQLAAVSRTDQQIMARSSSNEGKDEHQLLLRLHLKMWSMWIVQNPVGNQSRAEDELDPFPVSSHSHTQQNSSPGPRGESVQLCWHSCVSSQHTGTNITPQPHSPFSHRHYQSPVVALQVTTCPALGVQSLKSLLHFKCTLFLKLKEDKCLRAVP